MRILEYNVEKNVINKKPRFDYSGLIPRSGETVCLKFTFTNEWQNTAKVVEFTARNGSEYKPQILVNNMCMIPEEALNDYIFYIRVMGKSTDNLLLTEKLAICQNGGAR